MSLGGSGWKKQVPKEEAKRIVETQKKLDKAKGKKS